MDEDQRKRLGEVVERKKREAKEASERPSQGPAGGSAVEGDQPDVVARGRPQDVRDERKKSAGKGKKTADKWNQ